MRRSLLFVLLAASMGCAAPRAPEHDVAGGKVLLEVPFFPHRRGECGPAALASVLRYWGQPAEPSRLKEEIYLARLKGSLTVDLLLAAQARGLGAEMLEASLDQVRSELDAGHPLIAFVNVGFRFYPMGHYVVITGYNDKKGGFYAHSGSKRNTFLPYERFLKVWGKTENWALRVLPAGAA